MTQESQSEEVIIRYLLRELSDQERELVEKKYFDDPGFLDRIDAVEADLIDKYALGLLSGDERERVARHVLSSHSQRKKVEFAQELLDLIEQERQERSRSQRGAPSKTISWWESVFGSVRAQKLNLGVATAALVAVLGIGWVVVETVGLHRQLEQSRNEQAALEQQKQELQRKLDQQQENRKLIGDELKRLQDELNRLRANQSQVVSPAFNIPFLLAPTILKSGVGEQQKLKLPPGAGSIEMQLQLPFEVDNYPVYRAVIETDNGVEIWRGKAPRVRGKKMVAAVVPADRFDNRGYSLILRGKPASGEYEQVGIYPFTILKK